ncbi:MAG TPA: tail fiber protein [Acetobacteraceae bacterium]|jgi:microcystin-dependent protein|nr:tail fiber protein [Acetobacteraceae bacterium]
MSQPFIGQIVAVGFNFAPVDWHFCDGSLLAISQYSALYNLIGTTYGGDGVSTFALPDLRGRFAIHQGQGNGLSNYVLGQRAGEEQHTLTGQEMGPHNHVLMAGTSVAAAIPANGSALGTPATEQIYLTSGTTTTLASRQIGLTGSSQAHENRQPYLAINYIIALFGIYPTQ